MYWDDKDVIASQLKLSLDNEEKYENDEAS